MNETIPHNAFANDVTDGLTAERKFLSSKYFYDGRGSAIFRKIMKMPEYYPTNCELEILSLQSGAILERLDFREFNVVELGSGDGTKTLELLRGFLFAGAELNYIPVDISEEVLSVLEKNVRHSLPQIRMRPKAGDYFEVLEEISGGNEVPNLYLFLGGNIGNYTAEESAGLLSKFWASMKTGDKLLLGLDLRKNPKVIELAYDDPHGITKAFNMNLLRRMNSELETDFDLDAFDFYSFYNPENGEVNSYLVSLKNQTVYSPQLNAAFKFKANECIWTELSKKYTFGEIDQLAARSGFKIIHHYVDQKGYFTDSLWVK